MIESYKVLSYLIPNGGYVQRGDTFEGIEFLECEPITKKQYEEGFFKLEADTKKAEADKVAAKASAQAKLAALGLTEEEIASILG